jgi:hypothetical protein
MATHQIAINFGELGETPISQTVTVTADGTINEGEITVPANSTDLSVNQNIDVSALKSLFLLSDKAMTIQTNSGTTPDNTITLAAGIPLLWWEGCGHANPLTTDVTRFFLTTGNVGEAVLKMRGLMDLTP